MTTSGATPPNPNTPPATPPATPPGVPAGHVAISEAEHNRMNAELRKLKKDAGDREAADAAAATTAEREAAEARGAYDAALAAEQTARAAAEAKLAEVSVGEALMTEVTRLGFAGEQAAALLNLTDKSGITPEAGASEAIAAAVAKYPALFKQSPQTPAVQTIHQNQAPPPGPASTQYSQGHEGVEGFVTMEEYLRTPQPERLTDAFQARVEKSRPYWPSEVPASSFAQDS